MVPSAVRGMRSAAGKSPYGTEKARRTRGAMWKRRDRLVRPARAAAGGERNGPKFMPAPNKFSPLSKRAIRGSGPQPRGSLGTFHPWKVPRPGAKYPPSFSENRSHGIGKRQTSSGAPGRRALRHKMNGCCVYCRAACGRLRAGEDTDPYQIDPKRQGTREARYCERKTA